MSKKESAYASGIEDLDLGAVRQVEGDLDAKDLKFGIVASRYNAEFTGLLVSSAVAALQHHGAKPADVIVAWVPGAYEIPSALYQLALAEPVDALIGIGVVIQGETAHAGLINRQVAHSLARISRERGVPVLDGVVPAETIGQAEVRCRGGRQGRGWYLGCAAIEMARLFTALRSGTS